MIGVWQSVLSGALAAAIAVAVCYLIERLGGALGGVIGTVPGTVTPAALGLWYTPDSLRDFRVSMCSAPVGLAVNAMFLLSWRLCPPLLPVRYSLARRLALMVGVSLAVWAALAAPAVLALQRARPRAVYFAGAVCSLFVFIVGVAGTWRMAPAPKGSKPVSVGVQAARGALAFAAVTAAVLLSHLSSASAGVFAVFPAVFLTTMVSLWLAQGEACQAGAVSPMMLGLAAPMAFCLLSCLTFPAFGGALGCAAAWLSAVACGTLPLGMYIKWRERVMLAERHADEHAREVHEMLAVSLLTMRDGAPSDEDGDVSGVDKPTRVVAL